MGRTLVLCVAAAAAGAACDRFYVVRGKVSSCADQRPIAGAVVRLSGHDKRGFAETGADGTFRAALNEPDGDDPSRLTVAQPGFRTIERLVTRPHEEQGVCLPPEP